MSADKPIILAVRGVGFSYEPGFSVYNVTFDVPEASVCCLMGPNGSGKTTLFSLLSGALLPIRGEVYFHGQNLHRELHSSSRNMIAMPFHPVLYSLRSPYLYWQATGARYGLSFKQTAERIAELVPQMDMTPHMHKRYDSLSLGMRQKVALVALFIPDVPLRLIDEPFSGGIDPLAMEVLAGWIEVSRDRGETFIFSAQMLEHAQRLADNVLVLKNGQLASFGSPQDIVRQAGIAENADRAFAQAYVEITEGANS